ncbi:hypothetical protein MNEG_14184 [Monoraphidium neglectum]|uniref:Cytoplasmic tRNA 2-thiolation protein 1 C-terminal domain-containing protein n=1 Tax=Monoraphidium neglectum TaxID=145388 RepID=A0A0D2LPV8_9CHLO|nr:hypothetical protein MNEG_14184 [Monoraphidium neglectum]KIY93779.1 hypothetical protein MNEG_14184 [Monoraphidium neglectum]|eukprot:XP_013892799.1 hypothetical protein MNEG_14184 [Monoraphidium neglectum]
MYAYFKRLDYFSTECVYAPFAARGFARDLVKDLEACRPSAIIDLIHSAESWTVTLGGAANGSSSSGGGGGHGCGAASAAAAPAPAPGPRDCERCGSISSQPVCKACLLLEGLNKGLPRLGISKVKGGGRAGAAAAGAAAAGAAAAGGAGEGGRGGLHGCDSGRGSECKAGGAAAVVGEEGVAAAAAARRADGCCGGGGCAGGGADGDGAGAPGAAEAQRKRAAARRPVAIAYESEGS